MKKIFFLLALTATALFALEKPVFEKDFSKDKFVQGSKVQSFDAKGIIGKTGTMILRIRPGWNGIEFPNRFYYIFSGAEANGKQRMQLWFWTWLRADIPVKGNSKWVQVRAGTRTSVIKNDTIVLALVWNRKTWSELYVDGELAGSSRFTNADPECITKFFIGSDVQNGYKFYGKIENVRIYNKALSAESIRRDYADQAVFDFVFDRSLYQEGKNNISFSVLTPGETAAFRQKPGNPVSGNLKAVLTDAVGNVLLKHDFGKITTKPYGIELKLPPVELKKGICNLELTAESGSKKMIRVFQIAAITEKPLMAPPSDHPFKLGKPFFEKIFPGKYLEVAPEKMANTSVKVPIPEKYQNSGHLVIEVEWPDDKPRNMAFYMFPDKGSGSEIRDRLGQGITAGNEYRNSGKMRIVCYPFIASRKSYLFEARTMSNGKPAAIKALRIYPVIGEYSELKINYPEGLPHRRLGHLDEDQTVDYNLDWDGTRPKLSNWFVDARIIRNLTQYYKMTGQNYFSLPLLRYDWNTMQTTPIGLARGAAPFHTGSIPYWIETLADNGIKTSIIINLWGAPGMANPTKEKECKANDRYTRRADGTWVKSNPFHPEVRKLYLAEIRELLRRFGKLRGLDGIDLWIERSDGGLIAKDLDLGYDDTTIALFSKETGVKVPEFDKDVFAARYHFLTTGSIRAKWLAWRAGKTMEMIRAIRSIMDEYNPALRLYITNTPQPYREQYMDGIETMDIRRGTYENCGLDLAALAKMKNVFYIPLRMPSNLRWWEHWNNSGSTVQEAIWKKSFAQSFRSPGLNFASCYRIYFETFKNSPDPKNYPAVFQNADLKAPGRWFLRDYVLPLALDDAVRITSGGQPLATFGGESEIREFAQAYCALPEASFTDIPDADDPVTIRYLHTKNGTYLYAVNMIHSPVQVVLKGNLRMKDLSTLKINGSAISLKPFELRSFLISGKVIPKIQCFTIPEKYAAEIQNEVCILNKTIDGLEKAGGDVRKLKQQFLLLQTALQKTAYAEAERLLYSRIFREIAPLRQAIEKGWLAKKTAMLKRSHFAVNTGSSEFFEASDKRLFFPDQKWSEIGRYGYYGSSRSVTRSTAEVPKSNPLRKVFETELFWFSEYRFSVQPGKYTVKLHLRAGYDPGRKPGEFVMKIGVNGKTIFEKYDVFTHEKNGTALIEMKGISPEKGLIRLSFRCPHAPSNTLLNAVEVIPE